MAIKSGYTNIIPVECSCSKMVELFKALGSWCEDDGRKPNPGDIMFYDWEDNGVGDNKGNANHVGIVEKVSNGVITVIEGNKNSAVERREIKVDGKYIRGYGVPKYDAEPIAKKSVAEIAKEVLQGKWGNGEARKTNLTNAGYNYNEVQAKVNELIKSASTTPAKKSNTEIAKEVIAGKWGNGAEREQKLVSAGYDYAAIQKIVNDLLK
jgi:hypothetical protein